MQKIVINDCYGGFGLTDEALRLYFEFKGIEFTAEETGYELVPFVYYVDGKPFNPYMIERDDPALVQIVENMGRKACEKNSSLKILEIPDDVEWVIKEYDGNEHVAEKHRTWY